MSSNPNILLIMSDQHRADWLGTEQPAVVDTPHIDRLVETGVSFREAYCTSPLCAPSRSSLATGLLPHRVGVLGNNANLRRDQTTYYQVLRESGYRVGLVGKLDLNKANTEETVTGDSPLMYHLGFTDPYECEGKMTAGLRSEANYGPYAHYLADKGLFPVFAEDYRRRLLELPVWYAADSVLPTEDFEDAFIGERACEMLDRLIKRGTPWHMFVSFVGPHDPWDPPKQYADRYRTRSMPIPIEDPMVEKPAWQKRRQKAQGGASTDDVAIVRRQYTAMVKLIDDWVGEMLSQLEKSGALEDTIIIYASDHGEMLGDHGLYQKSCFYDASVRVPLVVTGPGVVKNTRVEALVELHDLAPTILELANAPVPPRLDAKSFLPILRGEKEEHRSSVVSEISFGAMLATREAKLVLSEHDQTELYDRTADPDELQNTASHHGDEVGRLRGLLRNRMK